MLSLRHSALDFARDGLETDPRAPPKSRSTGSDLNHNHSWRPPRAAASQAGPLISPMLHIDACVYVKYSADTLGGAKDGQDTRDR